MPSPEFSYSMLEPAVRALHKFRPLAGVPLRTLETLYSCVWLLVATCVVERRQVPAVRRSVAAPYAWYAHLPRACVQGVARVCFQTLLQRDACAWHFSFFLARGRQEVD